MLCLVDGFSVPEFERPQRAIVDGDATSAAIAAASIVAKVTRDRYMHHADAQHPGWSFAEHVGYSTPVHREAILRQGVSPCTGCRSSRSPTSSSRSEAAVSAASGPSPRPFDVIETHKPVLGVEDHADCVEAQGLGGGSDAFLIA